MTPIKRRLAEVRHEIDVFDAWLEVVGDDPNELAAIHRKADKIGEALDVLAAEMGVTFSK